MNFNSIVLYLGLKRSDLNLNFSTAFLHFSNISSYFKYKKQNVLQQLKNVKKH